MTELIELFKTQLASNDFLSGGIGVASFSALLYLCRQIPAKIYNFIDRNLVWTVRVNNDNHYYVSFLSWTSQFLNNNTKRLKIERNTEEAMFFGPNYGFHWRFSRGAFIIIQFEKEEAQNTLQRKDFIVVKIYSPWGKKVFDKMLEEIMDIESEVFEKNYIYDFIWVWKKIKVTPKRKLDSVYIYKDKKDQIINAIDCFNNNKDFYQKIGIPYKYAFLFYGQPGTGKSSLIQALADQYRKNIAYLDFSLIENGTALKNAFADIPKNSLLVLEDIDCHDFTKDRKLNSGESDKPAESPLDSINLSTVLQLMDGVYLPEGTIIIATTNHIEKLDPALIRDGRFDMKVELEPANQELAEVMCMEINPSKIEEIKSLTYPVSQAKIQGILLK